MWEVPHLTSTTKRKLATKSPIKKSTQDPPSGQQGIGPTFKQTGNKNDARILWVSSGIDVAQSNQCRKLHWLTNAEHSKREKVLPRNNRNT
jgi:hypothetical protein